MARTYFLLGVEHILSGIDHLAFVLALLILLAGLRLPEHVGKRDVEEVPGAPPLQ